MGKAQKIIWVHCASLGEFEQGRPIIEKLKITYPNYEILLTFFSPSGYEIRKDYSGVDAVFYLPMDGKKNATQFLNIVQPTLVIWVKYEYWFYYLTILKKRAIPLILVSAIFRPSQPFFKWYGQLWKKMLLSFTKIFVQNEASIKLLQQHGLGNNAALAGDTRFDRVIDITNKTAPLPNPLLSFCNHNNIIVAGSTWQDDELALVHYARIHAHIKIIIAPHEVDEMRLVEIEKLFTHTIRYSSLTNSKTEAQVLIIDNIGMLATLYKVASITYIGGGFNASGIHNILEAAVYAKPIVFGSEYEKFKEATDLVALGGAQSFDTALELEVLLNNLFEKEVDRLAVGNICKKYVLDHTGATDIIIKFIKQTFS